MATKPLPIPEIAADVRHGLTRFPKSLPPKLFYDKVGSELFEQITRLPEYYLTRTERAIFTKHAGEIIAAAGQGISIIELGAGTAEKTRLLIAEALRRQLSLVYQPVDVSDAALKAARAQVRREFPRVEVEPVIADYTNGFRLDRTLGPQLVLWIGSSVGNFEQAEASAILRKLSRQMRSTDALLLGTDLAKPPEMLLPAYGDSQGITEQFNKNILGRINRELGGHFQLDQFRHVAIWNREASRMEIYLESFREQRVRIDALGLTIPFAPGERIHTENSYKYTPRMLNEMMNEGGFCLERTWTDERRWFAVHLARPAR